MEYLTSLLGNSSIKYVTRAAADETSAPFLSPQPVGLTNLQSKLIGPSFTAHPQHRHPSEATPIEALRYLVFQVPLKSDVLIHHAAAGGDGDPLANSGWEVVLAAESLVDYSGTELIRALLASKDDELSSQVSDPRKCAPLLETLQALAAEDELDNATLISIAHVPCVRPSKQLLGSAFGHGIERAVSVAISGRPCRYNVLNEELVALLRTSDIEAVLTDAGVLPTARALAFSIIVDAVARGAEGDDVVDAVRCFLLAHIVRRPIITRVVAPVADDAEGTMRIFLPACAKLLDESGAAAATVLKQPIIIVNGFPLMPTEPQTADGEASLPVLSMDCSRDGTIVYPASGGANLEAFLDFFVDESNERMGYLMRPSAPLPSIVTVVRDGANAVPSDPCDRYTEVDPSTGAEVLSFRSFPGCAFSLGHDAARAKELVSASGYGKDESGAAEYLEDVIKQCANVVTLHVDGDGHCLLHSISRALVGKEYLWHALRAALYRYMRANRDLIKRTLVDAKAMADDEDKEMDALVARSHVEYGKDSSFVSRERGLGTEHIFALANMLRRPILLVDSPLSPSVEAYVFLPLLVQPEELVTRKLLVIGWSNQAHAHYVPIVRLNGALPATIKSAALARNSSGAPMVYALPDGANAVDALRAYLCSDAASALAEGALPELLEIGGETTLDINVWCQGLVDELEKGPLGGMSFWAIHEFARYFIHSNERPYRALSELACVRDPGVFLQSAIETLRAVKLGVCPICTRTRDMASGGCCARIGNLRELNLATGIYRWNEGDRVPIESTRKYNCCVYKHWTMDVMVAPQYPVFARNYSSAFAAGVVLAVSRDGQRCNIQFADGSVRFNVLVDSTCEGLFVDFAPSQFKLLSLTKQTYQVSLHYDANPILRSDVERVVRAMLLRSVGGDLARLETLPDASGENLAAITRTVRKKIEDLALRVGRREAQDPLAEAQLNDFDPVTQDNDGNPVAWQWYNDNEYESYHPAAMGKIEAAFVAGEASTIIEIPYMQLRFRIDFMSMQQKNNYGFGRAVRRLVLLPWECPDCTLNNEARSEYCAACGRQRPPNSFVETDSFEKKNVLHLSALDRADIIEDDREMVETAAADPRIAKGGSLYLSALEVARTYPEHLAEIAAGRFPHMTIRFPGTYGSQQHFLFDNALGRFIPVPYLVTKDSPFYSMIEREGVASSTYFRGTRPCKTWLKCTFIKTKDEEYYFV